MNAASFCLYGDNPLYVKGLVANLRLAATVYPGWAMLVFTDCSEPICRELQSLGATVFRCQGWMGHMGMFARFLPLADPKWGYVIIRDADSRLNVREKAAVDAWIASGKTFHVMRDHDPGHRNWPILGGLFGGKGGSLPDIIPAIAKWPSHTEILDDMKFLAAYVWPKAKDDMKHHSSIVGGPFPGDPFPPHEPYSGYCGEIIKVVV